MNAVVPVPPHGGLPSHVAAPMDGEILLAGDTVTVVAALNPLSNSHSIIELPAGLSLREIVERVARRSRISRLATGLVVYVGDHAVPRANWHRVRPRPGTRITLRAVARGGGGGIFKSLLMIALVVFAAFAVPFLTPIIGGTLASAAGAVILAGGSLLLNMLFPTRPAQLGEDKRKTSYSIGGGKNEATQYGPVSVILGKIRVQPKYAASAYTEFHGSDQYLRLLFCAGYGPLDITDIKIGETKIEEYDDVTKEIFYGYSTDGAPTLYPSQVIQEDLTVDLTHAAGWITRTTTDDVTEISADLVWAQGLLQVSNKKGKRMSRDVRIEAQYRLLYDTGDWTSLGVLAFSAKTNDTIRKTIRGVVPKGRYDVRVRKASTDYDGDDRTTYEQVQWTALRGMRNDAPLHFPDPIAVIALRIRATDQLNGVIDDLNCICTSRVKAYDEASDTWVDDTPSQNPADLFRWVLQMPANKRPSTDAEIDTASLELWHRYCTLKGFKFNQERDFTASVQSTLQDIASAGRAVVTQKDGKWSVVWDDANATPVQHFTPRNSSGFSSHRDYRDMPHGWRVRFVNEKRDYLDDERLVFADGYDKSTATKYEQVEFPGVTDPDLIWKHGRFHYAQIKLRPETYRLTVDFENLVCTKGDRVYVSHDVPKWGVTDGRVKAVSGDVVTLDEQIIMDPDKTYSIRFRNKSGSIYRTVSYVEGYTKDITLTGDGGDPTVGDLFSFGEAEQETVILRVLGIEAADDLKATLSFVDDAPDIQTADTGTIPAYDSQITQPVDPKAIRPTIDKLVEGVTTDGSVLPVSTLVWHPAATTSPVSYEVVKRFDEGGSFGSPDTVPAPVNRMSWVDIAPGAYTFRVCAIFADGSRSTWAEWQTYVLSSEKVPPDVENLVINALGDVATISWDAPDEPVAFLELRYSPATSGATWQAAAPLVLRATGTSLQTALNSGTYLAKFVSGSGGYSANASEIIVTNGAISSMNVAEDLFDLPPFEGTFDDTYETDGTVRLTYTQDIFEYDDLFDVPDIFLGTEGIADEGTYTIADRIELGAVFTSRVSAEVLASGVSLNSDIFALPDLFEVSDLFGADPASWAVTIQMRTTNDDPTADSPAPTWTDWFPLVIGDYTARAFEFRLLLESFEFGITPAVQSFHARVDMPDRFEKGKDLVVPTTGLRVDFDPAFLVLKGIARFDQDLATGDYAVVSNKDESGFDISYKDASGNAVERTFDFVAAGYGAVIAA